MDDVTLLLNQAHGKEIVVAVIAGFIVVQFLIKLFDYFRERFGITTAATRREKEQSEAITTLKSEMEQIKQDQTEVMACLTGLKKSVDDMQKKQDAADRARLKDRIAQSYRQYKEKGCWTSIEKEAFNDLVLSYEEAGGENSFVHDICVPASLGWNVID